MVVLTEQLYPALEQLSQEIELLKQTNAFATKVGKLFVAQWNMALAMRRETRALRYRVKAIIQKAHTAKIEIDPDDEFIELILGHQQAVCTMIQSCNELLCLKISVGARWMIRWSRRLLIASHADLDWSRTAIMKHNDQVMEDEDTYWALEADAALDRLARGEDSVITLEQWEARHHGLGG